MPGAFGGAGGADHLFLRAPVFDGTFGAMGRAVGAVAATVGALGAEDVEASDFGRRFRAHGRAEDRLRNRLVLGRRDHIPLLARLIYHLLVQAPNRRGRLGIGERSFATGVGLGVSCPPSTVRYVGRMPRCPAFRPPDRHDTIGDRRAEPCVVPTSAGNARLDEDSPTVVPLGRRLLVELRNLANRGLKALRSADRLTFVVDLRGAKLGRNVINPGCLPSVWTSNCHNLILRHFWTGASAPLGNKG